MRTFIVITMFLGVTGLAYVVGYPESEAVETTEVASNGFSTEAQAQAWYNQISTSQEVQRFNRVVKDENNAVAVIRCLVSYMDQLKELNLYNKFKKKFGADGLITVFEGKCEEQYFVQSLGGKRKVWITPRIVKIKK